jgi:hypothetical protein
MQELKRFFNSFILFEMDKVLLTHLINMVIVSFDGRPSCFVETGKYCFKEEYNKYLDELSEILKLKKCINPLGNGFTGYLYYKHLDELPKTSTHMGKCLGYTYTKSNFSDYRLKRIVVQIKDTSYHLTLSTELIVYNDDDNVKHLTYCMKKTNKWQTIVNKHLNFLNLQIKMNIRSDNGTIERKQNIIDCNHSYIELYKDDYLNDIANFGNFSLKEEFNKNYNILHKELDFYYDIVSFYNKINKEYQ